MACEARFFFPRVSKRGCCNVQVENLSYMTSETWKEQENFGDDVEDETFIIEDYRNAFFGEDDDDDAEPKASDRIFRKYDWNEIDSSFKMI